MKNWLFPALLWLTIGQLAIAQAPKFEEKSDPAAKKILDGIRDKYQKYPAIQAEFALLIENGEQKEEQSGKLSQKGNLYNATLGSREMICDGKTVWMVDKKENEVQISDYDPNETEVMSPEKLFKIHESEKDYVYAITSEDASMTYIEFKPLDKNADFFKIRLGINKAKNDLSNIKIFGKDGSRYTFTMKKIAASEVSESTFKFDKAKYPGILVTDLR